MKLPYLAPALLLHALLAPFAMGQTMIPNPATGNVSTVKINLTINETAGGWKISDTKKTADAPKLITYPDTVRYDAVFLNSTDPSNILNPFGWDNPTVTHYVERVTTKPETATRPMIVTAEGSNVIKKTRYTNATLLAELAAAGLISAPKGYRIVAVRFDTLTNGEDVFDNTARGFLTLVKPGLYFFAERGANDAAPVFLGAEDNVYAYSQIIDFSSFETVQAGKYKDVFTGRSEEQGGGFAYSLVSDSFTGKSLAEVAIYRRPATTNNYYELRAGGVFNWKETYNNKNDRNTYNRGAINGKNLTGPGTAYVDGGVPLSSNSGIVTGAITLPAAKYQANLNKYLLQIPPLAAQ
jgi:hypothetical protein